ncbi:MAG: class I SAM-dependent methyltransferase [Rubrobacteraceae bacterium]
MSSVEEHYEALLAPHYTWMRGDYDSRVRENRNLFEEVGILPRKSGKALDLGCGSGFQSVALAQLGFEVVSVDSSGILLQELRDRLTTDLAIRPVLGDMRDPQSYAENGPFEVAVCMGDTLTHLRSREEVSALIRNVCDVLEEGGKLVLQFRDLTRELKGANRAIPVRTDDEKIMATFLEYEPEHVNVHDMIFVKETSGWTMRKSAYKKVRLGAKEALDFMEKTGFEIVSNSEDKSFSTIIGRK